MPGIDVRQSRLIKARFAPELHGLKNVTCEECKLEDSGSEIGPYDLCLFLGLLVRSLRNISSITGEVCIIETPVVDESSPRAGAGQRLGDGFAAPPAGEAQAGAMTGVIGAQRQVGFPQPHTAPTMEPGRMSLR